MDFKLEETDDLDEEKLEPSDEDEEKLEPSDEDEEKLEPSDEDEEKDINDEEEFDPLGFDDNSDEKDADEAVYESEEPDESQNEYDEKNELDEESSALVLEERIEIAPFNPQEENNFAYAEAVRAYYEEKNYEQAIEKFGEAIENEEQQTKDPQSVANEIVAKSKYWQAEAYVKTQDIPQAIVTFESLIESESCQEHYLTVAAQRRAETLKAKHS
jgi:tetratricopeptide (TPR) repeat protein